MAEASIGVLQERRHVGDCPSCDGRLSELYLNHRLYQVTHHGLAEPCPAAASAPYEETDFEPLDTPEGFWTLVTKGSGISPFQHSFGEISLSVPTSPYIAPGRRYEYVVRLLGRQV